MTVKTNILSSYWTELIESTFGERVKVVASKKYRDSSANGYIFANVHSDNNDYYLVRVGSSMLDIDEYAWYKITKQSKKVTFISEGPYNAFSQEEEEDEDVEEEVEPETEITELEIKYVIATDGID